MFKQQPADLIPIQAMRKAMVNGFALIPQEAQKELKERMELIRSVPELYAASLSQLAGTLQLIADLVADRISLERNDFKVLTFAGSIVGIMMGVQVYLANNPDADFAALMDQAMIHLEAGLPLTKE